MRKVPVVIALMLACLTMFGIGEAKAKLKYDLSLWRLFQVVDASGNAFARDYVTFGKISVSDTANSTSGTGLLLTLTKGSSNTEQYVWYNGKYALWTDADSSNTVDVTELDSSTSLRIEGNQAAFKTFLGMWGAMWAPPLLAPAETLGHNGFDISFIASGSYQFDGGADAWADAFDGIDRLDANKPDSPDPMMPILRLNMRKGLPYSTEIGINIGYFAGSKLFSLGTEFKVAVHEGFDNAPDFAFRFHYDHVFGSPELSTDLFGGDFSTSYEFGIGSMLTLTPYTGYSLVAVRGTAEVQNVSFNTEITGCDGVAGLCGNYDGPLIHFSPETVLLHRWFIGLRMIVAHFNFTLENVLSNKNNTVSVKLGVDF